MANFRNEAIKIEYDPEVSRPQTQEHPPAETPTPSPPDSTPSLSSSETVETVYASFVHMNAPVVSMTTSTVMTQSAPPPIVQYATTRGGWPTPRPSRRYSATRPLRAIQPAPRRYSRNADVPHASGSSSHGQNYRQYGSHHQSRPVYEVYQCEVSITFTSPVPPPFGVYFEFDSHQGFVCSFYSVPPRPQLYSYGPNQNQPPPTQQNYTTTQGPIYRGGPPSGGYTYYNNGGY